MKYKLASISKSGRLLPWVRVFSTLCIPQIRLIYDTLDFPMFPDEELQEVARRFVFTEQKLRGNDLPDVPDDLFVPTLPDGTYEQKQEALFDITFSALEHKGYASKVYQWGKESIEFTDSAIQKTLQSITNLLRMWSISEWDNMSDVYSSEQHPKAENLVHRWKVIYAESKSIMPNSIPKELPLREIHQTIIKNELIRSEAEDLIGGIKKAQKSAIENFIFINGIIGGTWIEVEVLFRIRLREWKELTRILSSNEIHQLEQWALEHRNIYPWAKHLTVPLISI